MESPLLFIRGFKFNLDKFNLVTNSTYESLGDFMDADTNRFITRDEARFFKLIHHAPNSTGSSSVFICNSYYSLAYNGVLDKEMFESMYDDGDDSELNNIVGAILARIADRIDDVDTEELGKIFGDIVVNSMHHCTFTL